MAIENNYGLTRNEQMLKKFNLDVVGKEILVKEIISFKEKDKLPYVSTRLENSIDIGVSATFKNGVTMENITNIDFSNGTWLVQTKKSLFELKVKKESTKK